MGLSKGFKEVFYEFFLWGMWETLKHDVTLRVKVLTLILCKTLQRKKRRTSLSFLEMKLHVNKTRNNNTRMTLRL